MHFLGLLLLGANGLLAQGAASRIEIVNYRATKQLVEFDLINRADAPIAAIAVFFHPCASRSTQWVGTVGRPPYWAVGKPLDPKVDGPRLIGPGETRRLRKRNSFDCKLKLDRVSAAFTDGSVIGDPRDFDQLLRVLKLKRAVADRWLASVRQLQNESEPARAVEQLLVALQKEYAQLTASRLGVDHPAANQMPNLPKQWSWPIPGAGGLDATYPDGQADRDREMLAQRNGTASRKREMAQALLDLTYLIRPLYDRLAPLDAVKPKPGEWRLDPTRRNALPKQESDQLIAREIAWLEAEGGSLSWLSRFAP